MAAVNEKKAAGTDEHFERSSDRTSDIVPTENPLVRYTSQELITLAERFATEHELTHISDDLRKGALLAQNPDGYDNYDLSPDERTAVVDEIEHSA